MGTTLTRWLFRVSDNNVAIYLYTCTLSLIYLPGPEWQTSLIQILAIHQSFVKKLIIYGIEFGDMTKFKFHLLSINILWRFICRFLTAQHPCRSRAVKQYTCWCVSFNCVVVLSFMIISVHVIPMEMFLSIP